jgi:glycosyltransferase involved in cell wall biosynthesis
MGTPTLSVIIPVYNERESIVATLQAAIKELESASGFDAEFVIVDDGSTDGTRDVAAEILASLDNRVVSQPNLGRLAARRSGLAVATGQYVLLLDSRVQLVPGSLAFAAARIAEGEQVWNAHVHIATVCNPYGHFWNVLTELAFADYFANPRTTCFATADFDRYPKGTTCFLAPRNLMREAFTHFRTRYRDERNANDDTPILRWLAGRTPIHISPRFACWYQPRRTFKAFWGHAFHRGVVFLDGHGRPESRFFPAVTAFYPASAVAAIVTIRWPLLALGLVGGVAAAACSLAVIRRRSPVEVAAFGGLAPVYAASHGLGMWTGLGRMLGERLARRRAVQ